MDMSDAAGFSETWHTADGHPVEFGATSIDLPDWFVRDLSPLEITILAEHVRDLYAREMSDAVLCARREAATVSPSSIRFRRRLEERLASTRDSLPFCQPADPRAWPTPYEPDAWRHWVMGEKPIVEMTTLTIAEGLQAQLDRDGGFALFPGLFCRRSGTRIRAKLIPGRFGPCWAMCDDADNYLRFLGDARTKRGKLYKDGFVVLGEWAPAGVLGDELERTDGGFPVGSKVLS